MSGKDNSQGQQSWIAKVGRMLPESNILFLYLTLAVIVASFIFQGTYETAVGDSTITVKNMLSVDGLRWIFYNFIGNFVKYPPLGIVVVGVIGFGFAEKTGLLGILIKKLGIITPDSLILPVVIFLGINSSVASDAGYVVLIPLAGALYAGLGKNPLIGITAAFAGVSAGFGAALIPTPGDALLGGITKSIADTTEYGFGFTNEVTINYIFMIVSTFYLTIVITFVAKKFANKNVEQYSFIVPDDMKSSETEITDLENKGLKNAGIAFVIVLGVMALLAIGPLGEFVPTVDYRNALVPLETTNPIKPLIDNIIVVMIVIFLVPSIVYGKTVGSITDDKSYVALTARAMSDMSYFLVFAIFAGNFLAIFGISGLSQLIANSGAKFLIDLNITSPIVLMVGFMIITAFINLFMGSASAKWNLLATIFIPMLLMTTDGELGAEVIQAGYRIADSSTNVITPLMSYAGIILLACKRYVDDFEYGDLMSLMIPYSIGIFVSWTSLFIIWMLSGLPFGIS